MYVGRRRSLGSSGPSAGWRPWTASPATTTTTAAAAAAAAATTIKYDYYY